MKTMPVSNKMVLLVLFLVSSDGFLFLNLYKLLWSVLNIKNKTPDKRDNNKYSCINNYCEMLIINLTNYSYKDSISKEIFSKSFEILIFSSSSSPSIASANLRFSLFISLILSKLVISLDTNLFSTVLLIS